MGGAKARRFSEDLIRLRAQAITMEDNLSRKPGAEEGHNGEAPLPNNFRLGCPRQTKGAA